MTLAELRVVSGGLRWVRSRLARRGPLHAALVLAATALWMDGPALAQETPPTWYAERITSGDTPVHVEHLWSKGPKFRSETVIGGRPIVTLVNGERYISFDRLSKSGVSIQRSAKAISADRTRGRPFGNEWSILETAGGEKISTERLAGRDCDLFRLTNSEGRREVCVSQDEARLPLQLRVWDRTSGREARTHYLDWTSGLSIDDSFFEPEVSVKLEYLSYEEYLRRAPKEQLGPAPPFFRELLHGSK